MLGFNGQSVGKKSGFLFLYMAMVAEIRYAQKCLKVPTVEERLEKILDFVVMTKFTVIQEKTNISFIDFFK